MTSIVDFDVAKLLKEKEFEQETLHFYTKPNSKMFGIDEHGRAYKIKNSTKELYKCGENVTLNSTSVIFAPTIAEVVMWLYEKHNLWISVFTIDKWLPNGNDRLQIFDYTIKQMKNGLIDIPKKLEEFDSIKETYQEAIKHCLNHLI